MLREEDPVEEDARVAWRRGSALRIGGGDLQPLRPTIGRGGGGGSGRRTRRQQGEGEKRKRMRGRERERFLLGHRELE